MKNNVIPTGDTLSSFRRVTQQTEASASYTPNINLLEVAFSPQNQINDDIIGQLGYFNMGDYIGDPRQRSSSLDYYPDLNKLRNDYFEKYLKNYDLVDFVRLIKFFDNSLFKMIKDFIPARTSLASGLVIKQHLLERNKYPQPQLDTNTYLLPKGTICNELEAGGASQSGSASTETWVNLSRVYSGGSTGNQNNNAYSKYILTNNYKGNIPLGATILGIEVSITKYASDDGLLTWTRDNQIYLSKNTGNISEYFQGDNKADQSTNYPTSTTTTTYGGPTDLWGQTWTPEEINSPNFGVQFRIRQFGVVSAQWGFIDSIDIKVCYVDPPYKDLLIQGTVAPQWNNYEEGTIEDLKGGPGGNFSRFNYTFSSFSSSLSSSYFYADTVTESGSGGSWITTPGLAEGPCDGGYAATVLGSPSESKYLLSGDYGFNIPLTSTIRGIKVTLCKKANTSSIHGHATDKDLYLSKNTENISEHFQGDNKADTSTYFLITDYSQSYGGETSLWGQSWTPSEINSPNFGIQYNVKQTGSIGLQAAGIEGMRIGVFWEEYQVPGDLPYLNQSWYEYNSSLSGSIPQLHDTQDEFYNGEFTGSTLLVTNGELNPGCDIFKNVDARSFPYAIRFYHTKKYAAGPDSGSNHNYWSSGYNQPLAGNISIAGFKTSDGMVFTNTSSILTPSVKIAKRDGNGRDQSYTLKQIDQIQFWDTGSFSLIAYSGSYISQSLKLNVSNIKEYVNYYEYTVDWDISHSVYPTDRSVPQWNWTGSYSDGVGVYRYQEGSYFVQSTGRTFQKIEDRSTVEGVLYNSIPYREVYPEPLPSSPYPNVAGFFMENYSNDHRFNGLSEYNVYLPSYFEEDLLVEVSGEITASNTNKVASGFTGGFFICNASRVWG